MFYCAPPIPPQIRDLCLLKGISQRCESIEGCDRTSWMAFPHIGSLLDRIGRMVHDLKTITFCAFCTTFLMFRNRKRFSVSRSHLKRRAVCGEKGTVGRFDRLTKYVGRSRFIPVFEFTILNALRQHRIQNHKKFRGVSR